MPVLCMFYGIIVRMYREMGGKHNMPHIHAEYSRGKKLLLHWTELFLKEKIRAVR